MRMKRAYPTKMSELPPKIKQKCFRNYFVRKHFRLEVTRLGKQKLFVFYTYMGRSGKKNVGPYLD